MRLYAEHLNEFVDPGRRLGNGYGALIHLSAFLRDILRAKNVDLIDFKLEFGRDVSGDGEVLLADEISPDNCRFWDVVTHEKLDKDRFRNDMGGVEEAYQEMLRRLTL